MGIVGRGVCMIGKKEVQGVPCLCRSRVRKPPPCAEGNFC